MSGAAAGRAGRAIGPANPIPRASVSERAGARFPTAQLVSRGWGLLTVFISHPIPSSHVN